MGLGGFEWVWVRNHGIPYVGAKMEIWLVLLYHRSRTISKKTGLRAKAKKT